MKLLIIGNESHLQEAKAKSGEDHEYEWAEGEAEGEDLIEDVDVVFDFIIDESPEQFEIYTNYKGVFFLNTVKISLAELSYSVNHEMVCTVFGFNGLPTMFNKSLLEVSLLKSEDQKVIDQTCLNLNTEYTLVDDRVGLVTPRVVCMIINEAYYTVQEKTASREDIDMAMKLGTNYPFGPFEWCERIGIKNVYETLEAVYEDTKDERYKICPMLKKEYLKSS